MIINWKYLSEPIRELKPNQVFVFGSNTEGFHGMGAAFTAFTGFTSGSWREHTHLYAERQGTVGHWCVLGQSTGYQEGRAGASYAIPTVTLQGGRSPRSLRSIYESLQVFILFAISNPDKEFIVTDIGTKLARISFKAMLELWLVAFRDMDIKEVPSNLTFVTLVKGNATI